ncbi:hypothetical protein H2204_000739 [Knufia peltigerae]|uniref:Caffeine-induced death protein Cid2 n=1 Tax=Knufia peltigerae TaxID=1002370 RepID=A0AA38YFN6_9EURO|nr:hypothetical protein H2204_000739 [Knufia peltigerae]
MSRPTPTPPLTPQFCFDTRVLRDFLRLSRSSIDDSISTTLNALVTPASTSPFDPRSTAVRSPPYPRPPIPAPTTRTFLETVLFPSWSSRASVIQYCTSVATSPDPEDPESLERETLNRRDAERLVDERLDPYSARFFPREARTEMLASVLRNEVAVEGIIRTRTWGIVADRCEGVGPNWEGEFDRWKESTERKTNTG